MRQQPLDVLRRYEPIPDQPGLGAAMDKLSPQQRAFVIAFVDDGSGNASKAARAAGYGADSNSEHAAQIYRNAGSRCINNENILQAIKEIAQTKLASNAYKAANVLAEIMDDPTHKDRLKAAQQVLGHAGLNIVTESKVIHEHKAETRTEILARITVLAKQHGMDINTLLGGRASVALPAPLTEDVIDATFEEIAVPTADGLKDLL